MTTALGSEITNISRAPSAPVLEAMGPANEHFAKLSLAGIMIDIEVPVEQDELGFNYGRWQAGEADAAAGRVRPFADVMNALRSRVHRNRS